MKFGVRFKFLAILKQRIKKVNKKLNDRKNMILQIIDGEEKYIKGLNEYIDYIKIPLEGLNVLTV